MPIKIPNLLPATDTLLKENIFVMTETRAITQDIRPLHILMLNLMPKKVETETQIARLIGNTPLQVELELLQTATHKASHTSEEHMLAFYKTFDEVSKTHVTSTLHICWGAQAGLYYHYGIPKYPLEQKLFGVYEHTLDYNRSMLFRGYDDVFSVPHSRHTTTKREDMEAIPELRIMASSEEAGIFCAMTARGKQVYVMGHSEYDADTLKGEYLRDKNAGLPIQPPAHYFPDDDPTREPIVRWRSCANLFYSNWLNYYVYQTTPYDIKDIQ